MSDFPVIDLVATGKNIKRLRKKSGLTVGDLQKYFGFMRFHLLIFILSAYAVSVLFTKSFPVSLSSRPLFCHTEHTWPYIEVCDPSEVEPCAK